MVSTYILMISVEGMTVRRNMNLIEKYSPPAT